MLITHFSRGIQPKAVVGWGVAGWGVDGGEGAGVGKKRTAKKYQIAFYSLFVNRNTVVSSFFNYHSYIIG